MNADISTRDATNSNLIAGNGNVVNRSTFIFLKDTPEDTQELIDEPNPHPNPYRGLEAFREEHAPFYFGRDNVILKLQNIVYKQSLVALIGASGSGKSSLVFAGLVPKLRQCGQWVIADFRPKTQPFSNLALSLIHLLYQDKLQQAEKLTEFSEKLNTGAIGLPQIIQLILQENQDKRLLLIADQFEELYTLNPDKSMQQCFADRLLQALSEPCFSLLLTMRADFMSQAIDYRPFAEALNTHHTEFLAPMSEPELRAAIEKPAENCGVKLESGLTDLILKDLGNEPGNLPLLEFALTQLWEKQTFRQMTYEAYSDIGGVNEALARHADKVYAEFEPEEQLRLRQIFVQLVRPGQGTEDTRQVATYEQVKEENRNLIAKLADKRLIVTGRNKETGEETIEVVHEALIRNWQTLKEWMNEDREFRVWQERLRDKMRQFEASGCDDDEDLLKGKQLTEAEEWRRKRQNDLSFKEQRFIEIGLNVHKRSQRHKIILISAAFMIFVILSVVFGFLWKNVEGQRKIAKQERDNAEYQATTSDNEAQSVRASAQFETGGDEIDSLLEAMRAGQKLRDLIKGKNIQNLKAYPTVRPLLSLQKILSNIREKNQFKVDVIQANEAAFSPDGKMIATGGYDGTVRIFNLSGQEISRWEACEVFVEGLQFTPDGKYIVTGERTHKDYGVVLNKYHVWDLSGKQIAEIKKKKPDVHTKFSISPDGKQIAGIMGGCVRIWDLSGNQFSQIGFYPGMDKDDINLTDGFKNKNKNEYLFYLDSYLNLKSKGASCVSFSPDGKQLAIGSALGDVQIYDLSKQEKMIQFKAYGISVDRIFFSAAGNILTIGIDEEIGYPKKIQSVRVSETKLWNLSGQEICKLNFDDEKYHLTLNAAFSPDGKQIVTVGENGDVALWDLSGRQIDRFKGHLGAVTCVNFSFDGQQIVTGGKDGIRVWNLSKKPVARLAAYDGMSDLKFTPDGNQIIIVGLWDNSLRIFNLSGVLVNEFRGNPNTVADTITRPTPDGMRVVHVRGDGKRNKGKATLFDLSGKRIAELETNLWEFHQSGIGSPIQNRVVGNYMGDWYFFSSSSDGNIIATVGTVSDPLTRIWNFSDKKVLVLNIEKYSSQQVRVSPDGKYILTREVFKDNVFRIWDSSGKLLEKVKIPVGNKFSHARFIPDSKYFLTYNSYRDTAQIWDVSGKLITELKAQENIVELFISPDGKLIATNHKDNLIQVWDVSGKLIVKLKGYQGPASVAFSPDGQIISTVWADGIVRLFDLKGRLIAEFENSFNGYGSYFSPDGAYLAAFSNDDRGCIKIWDIKYLDGLLAEGCNRLKDYFISHPESKQEIAVCEDNVIMAETEKNLTRLNEIELSAANYYLQKGKNYIQRDYPEEAIVQLQNVFAIHPNNDEAWFLMGIISAKQKKPAEALESFKKVRAGKHYLDAQKQIAIILMNQGDLDSTLKHLDTVATDNEKEKRILQKFEADLLAEHKYYGHAMAIYDRLLKEHPDNTDLLFNRAGLADKMDNFDQVEKNLRRILEIDPKHINALNVLGYTLVDRTNRYQEAYDLLKQAVELAPENPYVLDSFGWVLYKMGRHTESLEHLKKAYGHSDKLLSEAAAENAAHLSEVLWRTGNQKEAKTVLEKAQKDFPDNERLRMTEKQLMN